MKNGKAVYIKVKRYITKAAHPVLENTFILYKPTFQEKNLLQQ